MEMITDKDYKKLLIRTLPFLRYAFKNGAKGLENPGQLIDQINHVINELSVLDKVRQIVNDAPELNILNYHEDQVRELNDAVIKIYGLVQ